MTLFANRTARANNAARRLSSNLAQGRRQAERRRFIDLFADCLAEGGAIDKCAARVGKTASWGEATFRGIRREINESQRAAGFGDWAV